MAKRVLVTGANGFLGRHVVRCLETSGCVVLRAVHHKTSETEHEFDLKDMSSVLNLKRLPKPDIVIHLATRVGWSGESLVDLFGPNVLGTANLLYLAEEWKAHFIFVSAAIVAGTKKEHITQDDPINPDTPYGISKYLAEQLLQASGLRQTILRLSGVFGADGPSHLGLNRSIAAALGGKPPTLTGDGCISRNYLYVEDAAQFIVQAACEGIEGLHFLAGSESSTISSMLQTLCDVLLPGNSPIITPGQRGRDHIVDSSSAFSGARGFRDSVIDIKKKVQTKCASAY